MLPFVTRYVTILLMSLTHLFSFFKFLFKNLTYHKILFNLNNLVYIEIRKTVNRVIDY